MAVGIFKDIVVNQNNQLKSVNWYRKQLSDMTDRATARKLMNDGKLTARPSIGRLNMFFYDPKYKKTLPLYDRFPLVLPLERIPNGFMGMNFHYVPPVARFRMLEQLQKFASDGNFDKSTLLQVSYDAVKGINQVKKTIKKYLYGYVRSSFLRIDVNESPTAVLLPVQQFKKGQPY